MVERIFFSKKGEENDGENIKKRMYRKWRIIFLKKEVQKMMERICFSEKGGEEKDGENIFFEKIRYRKWREYFFQKKQGQKMMETPLRIIMAAPLDLNGKEE